MRTGFAGWFVVLGLGLLSTGAYAQEAAPNLYDQPLETMHQAVDRHLVEDGGGLICYRFGEFLVKRIDSGSPAGDVAVSVVPIVAGSSRPVCTIATVPGEIIIKDSGYAFAGVKGDFLVLALADPNGAAPFRVHDRRTGKLLYSDATVDPGFTFLAQEGDGLHVRFRRGVNASCSILKDGPACWARIAREERFPAAVAGLPAPIGSCRVTYGKQKVPADDPSIVVYDVDMSVAPSGAHVNTRGEVSCEPMP